VNEKLFPLTCSPAFSRKRVKKKCLHPAEVQWLRDWVKAIWLNMALLISLPGPIDLSFMHEKLCMPFIKSVSFFVCYYVSISLNQIEWYLLLTNRRKGFLTFIGGYLTNLSTL
jgi:hypothetical protein